MAQRRAHHRVSGLYFQCCETQPNKLEMPRTGFKMLPTHMETALLSLQGGHLFD